MRNNRRKDSQDEHLSLNHLTDWFHRTHNCHLFDDIRGEVSSQEVHVHHYFVSRLGYTSERGGDIIYMKGTTKGKY